MAEDFVDVYLEHAAGLIPVAAIPRDEDAAPGERNLDALTDLRSHPSKKLSQQYLNDKFSCTSAGGQNRR